MQRVRGFTLIELLVVIAVVAILAALLFPVFTMAREKSKQTRCASNMKQLALAMMSYTDDNNGAFPLPCNRSMDWGRGSWRERVMPYCKNRKVFECSAKTIDFPIGGRTSATGTVEQSAQDGLLRNPFVHYGMAYGLTHASMGATAAADSNGFGYTFLSRVQLPSKTIAVAENKDGDWSTEPVNAAGAGTGHGCYYPYHLKTGNSSSLTNTTGGGNFIFCDGHSRFLTVPQSQENNFYLWKIDKSRRI